MRRRHILSAAVMNYKLYVTLNNNANYYLFIRSKTQLTAVIININFYHCVFVGMEGLSLVCVLSWSVINYVFSSTSFSKIKKSSVVSI